MITAFRWLLRLFFGIAALAGCALALAYYLALGSLPDYDARYSVAKLNAPLEIVRDTHAVPHIFGESDADVLYGLGFTHAQDRLWQMTLLRRTAQGRLSEMFGERTVSVDHLMRALGLYDAAVASVTALDPDLVTELQAYANGVNAYINLIQSEALGRGAPEFFLFSRSIAPWTPADSVALVKLMALQLSDKARLEVIRARLSLKLDGERIKDILPDPSQPVMSLPRFGAVFPEAPETPTSYAALWPPFSPVPELGRAGASNAFAAGPNRAAAGAPLLAADPHLGLSAPTIWMLARLELETGGAIGATIPGIPGILVGRSRSLAWGVTTAYMDDQDIFIDKLDPDDPTRVLTPDGSEVLAKRTVLITVDGGETAKLDLFRTRHGPVIPPPHFGVADITPAGHVASLAWTALTPEDTSIAAVVGIMRAQAIAEARDIGAQHIAPALNVVLADRENIALQVIGRAPDRKETHQGQGRMPVPGWVASNDWIGLRDYAENPSVTAPDGGTLANTNNQTSDAPFPAHTSMDWGDRLRIRRASALLSGREFHTLDSFIEIQTDAISPAARRVLPLIA